MSLGALFVMLFVMAPNAHAAGGGALIMSLGLLLGAAMLIAMVLTRFNQPILLAFVVAGAVGGIVAGREVSLQVVQGPLISGFAEIGIVLLLFMAGMSVNIREITNRSKLVFYNGLVQLAIVLLAFAGLMSGLLENVGTEALLFVAICLSLSSTLVAQSALEYAGARGSLHGQLATGIMLLHDLIAVVAIVLLEGQFRDAGGVQGMGMAVVKMFVLMAVLSSLSRYVLSPVFKYLGESPELMFVTALGYCMGVAAICDTMGFSQEAGAFFAGVFLGIIPQKLEIEDKVNPLKTFGVILFFLTLGFRVVTLEEGSLSSALGLSVVLAVVVLLLKPIATLISGWASRLKGRPAFLLGGTINHGSEFSLIIALLCREVGLFSDYIFALVTLTVLLSMFFAAISHLYLAQMYNLLRESLRFIDKRSASTELDPEVKLEDHVIILSYNELSAEIAEHYSEKGEKVLLMDLDPEIVSFFSKQDNNIVPLYADMEDPDVWEQFAFDKARVIVSCLVEGQEMELGIAKFLAERAPEVPFVAATDNHEDTLELYEAGVRYVITTDHLASKSFRQVFEDEITKDRKEAFAQKGKEHLEATQKIKEDLGEIFKFV
jgi:Kef-type K+ transport system membrane component KefB/Trk K+ transport system NAD-binding subunit